MISDDTTLYIHLRLVPPTPLTFLPAARNVSVGERLLPLYLPSVH
jgi:hypothetical protein